MFVSTAICGRRLPIDRSDSSPSTTSQPAPTPALPPSWGTMPPMIHDGSRPVSRSTIRDHPRRRRLPVRATDDDRRVRRHELGEEAPPEASLRSGACARSRRRLPTRAGAPARRRDRPRHRRASSGRSSRAASQPRTFAPQRARDVRVCGEPGAADADEVEPPPGERSLVSAGQVGSAPPRSRSAACGRASASIAERMRARRSGFASRSSTSPGTRSISSSGTTMAPPPRSKCRAFSVWWSAVACG